MLQRSPPGILCSIRTPFNALSSQIYPLHSLNMTFNEIDFLLVQLIFLVKLQVYIVDGSRPVNIGLVGKIL
jgi:hypothetical protein